VAVELIVAGFVPGIALVCAVIEDAIVDDKVELIVAVFHT